MVIEQFQDEKILTQVNEGSSPHAEDLGPNENFQNFYLEKPPVLLYQKIVETNTFCPNGLHQQCSFPHIAYGFFGALQL